MDIAIYQKAAIKSLVHPQNQRERVYYLALGLCGETGEVGEIVKKLMRKETLRLEPEARENAIEELGDVLWYLAALANELGIDLTDVAQHNLEKVASRHGTTQEVER